MPLEPEVEAVDTWGEYVPASQLPPLLLPILTGDDLVPSALATSPPIGDSPWWSAHPHHVTSHVLTDLLDEPESPPAAT